MRFKIRDLYHKFFPEDNAWEDINPDVTFQDLFDALDHRKDVYTVLPRDSVVRERCFSMLADIIGTSHEYIYEQWTKGE